MQEPFDRGYCRDVPAFAGLRCTKVRCCGVVEPHHQVYNNTSSLIIFSAATRVSVTDRLIETDRPIHRSAD